jgi:hypothetical protein
MEPHTHSLGRDLSNTQGALAQPFVLDRLERFTFEGIPKDTQQTTVAEQC